ncbi:Cytidylate kinase-like family protein [Desulfuromusa kysingii]|uniref:Cytidylate kinase-like family protein n=1 Tax=Desulfuromusa kysingii TaxID=37625 RepID=A0A1H4C0U3_9BACT|nr:cytidylate kinase-like family protein [Desulfuromusa kysingii]SEA53950.1 Cytidylate kinase-like family protein [Desulfuromusa kysingii]
MGFNQLWSLQQEEKLKAWHQVQLVADQRHPAPCFTITREFGCEAYALAEELIKRLNAQVAGEPWVVVGQQIIDEVARISGYSVEQIQKSQDTPSSLKAIFSMFLDSSRAEETEVFTHMREVIRSFAKRGQCVLVGRGSVLVTQDLSNCINLRLVAPLEFRVQKIMKSQQLNKTEAAKYIASHQQQRDDFIRRFAKGNIADPLLYHLLINNAHLGVKKIAELVEEYMVRYVN